MLSITAFPLVKGRKNVFFHSSLLEEEMATRCIFLPGKSQGQRSLAGYSPWGCKVLDTTEYAHTYMSNVGLTTAIQQNSLVMTSTWLDADDTCFSLELSVLFEYLQKIIFLK